MKFELILTLHGERENVIRVVATGALPDIRNKFAKTLHEMTAVFGAPSRVETDRRPYAVWGPENRSAGMSLDVIAIS